MEISVSIPDLDKIEKLWKKAPKELSRNLASAVARSTAELEGVSAKETPVDTGHLQRNIMSSTYKLKGEIYPRDITGKNVKYASAVHDGVPARTIYPKRKKVLVFRKNGKLIFAKKVRHPGIKANPFFTRAVEKYNPVLQRNFRRAIEKTMQG